MKILVVGSGGREHALVWKLKASPRRPKIFAAPGNAGIAETVACISVAADDVEGLVRLALKETVDLVVVGPEAPLVRGLADRLAKEKIPVFGPSQAAAQLEGSKAFAKEFMVAEGIPTAEFAAFSDHEKARRYLEEIGLPCVVKADGLAAGKGVFVVRTPEEFQAALEACFVNRIFGEAGRRVVIEEFLEGTEASVLAVCDGKRALVLAPAKDHKTIGEGDTGPNTGGMGATSPTPVIDNTLLEKIGRQVFEPALDGLRKRGSPFVGVLYAGLMLTARGIHVLEFNVRFGDPETQALLRRLQTDLVSLLEAAVAGRVDQVPLSWDPRQAICVVMSAQGYPGQTRMGDEITGLGEAGRVPEVVVFHAGTRTTNGRVVTAGGRVLGVTALGLDLREARERAYQGVGLIHWPGAYYRRDIGGC